MENYCNNCGAQIKDDTQFCPECGKKVENVQNICPNCGSNTEDSENFCENCGCNLNSPQNVETESFIEKYKLPIMVILLLFIIVISIPVSSFVIDEFAGTKMVNVESFSFKIPDNFNEDDENKLVSSDDPGTSKRWSNGDKYIEIWVLPPKYNTFTAADFLPAVGGAKHNKYGYTGYLNKFRDGGECFSYTENNKVITIFVSNEQLFDKIEIL